LNYPLHTLCIIPLWIIDFKGKRREREREREKEEKKGII
jgi:hypothetical protein